MIQWWYAWYYICSNLRAEIRHNKYFCKHLFPLFIDQTHVVCLSSIYFIACKLIFSSSTVFSHASLSFSFFWPTHSIYPSLHMHTQTPFSFLTSWMPGFLSPCSLKAAPNQLVCRNYRAINNEGQSAATETGGGKSRVMGPLLSACSAQDAASHHHHPHISNNITM